MEHFVKRLDKAYAAIDDADYILVGAGAGFLQLPALNIQENVLKIILRISLRSMV